MWFKKKLLHSTYMATEHMLWFGMDTTQTQILVLDGKKKRILFPHILLLISLHTNTGSPGWDLSWRVSHASEHWKGEIGYDTTTIKPLENSDFGHRMFHFLILHNS